MSASASARASRPTTGSSVAPSATCAGGSGASRASKENSVATSASHQLVVAAGTARDDDRARVLETAHDGHDAALRLLDDPLALRRLEVDLLLEELGAALGHVGEDPAAHRLLDAAQGDRQVLLVDLLEHHLDRPVVELDDVLEGEQEQAHLLGQLAVVARELVEHVALRRAVRVVEDVGERLDAA